MDDRVQRREPWVPWAATSLALVLVAAGAYSIGAHRAAVIDGPQPGAPGWYYSPFPGIWSLFVLFWIFGGLRWMWWGGARRSWGYRRPYRGAWRDSEREDWEDWHRRQHEVMKDPRSSGSVPSAADPAPGIRS